MGVIRRALRRLKEKRSMIGWIRFLGLFLGLTVSCARCHDHKFDPIPIEDYYSIAGVFNNTGEVEMPLVDHGIVQAYEAGRERIRNQEKVIKELRDPIKKLPKENQEEAKAHIESAEALLKVIKKELPPNTNTRMWFRIKQ